MILPYSEIVGLLPLDSTSAVKKQKRAEYLFVENRVSSTGMLRSEFSIATLTQERASYATFYCPYHDQGLKSLGGKVPALIRKVTSFLR